jgi:hypothetical protein
MMGIVQPLLVIAKMSLKPRDEPEQKDLLLM